MAPTSAHQVIIASDLAVPLSSPPTPGNRLLGSWPETGFAEITRDVLEADFRTAAPN